MQPPRQLATWNPDRDLWETDQLSIFEPLVAYSQQALAALAILDPRQAA